MRDRLRGGLGERLGFDQRNLDRHDPGRREPLHPEVGEGSEAGNMNASHEHGEQHPTCRRALQVHLGAWTGGCAVAELTGDRLRKLGAARNRLRQRVLGRNGWQGLDCRVHRCGGWGTASAEAASGWEKVARRVWLGECGRMSVAG